MDYLLPNTDSRVLVTTSKVGYSCAYRYPQFPDLLNPAWDLEWNVAPGNTNSVVLRETVFDGHFMKHRWDHTLVEGVSGGGVTYQSRFVLRNTGDLRSETPD